MLKEFDTQQRKKFGNFIIGIDEAGRGAWAHCLCAAAVCLPDDFDLPGLNDSKKLSEASRFKFFDIIKQNALAYSIQEISAIEIDSYGINWANSKAMERAGLNVQEQLGGVDLFIIDQSPCESLNPSLMFPKADGSSLSVAAASVLAKVHRDTLMVELHEQYPEYNFKNNKGYIDIQHKNTVNKLGVIKGIHRESYKVTGCNKPSQISLL